MYYLCIIKVWFYRKHSYWWVSKFTGDFGRYLIAISITCQSFTFVFITCDISVLAISTLCHFHTCHFRNLTKSYLLFALIDNSTPVTWLFLTCRLWRPHSPLSAAVRCCHYLPITVEWISRLEICRASMHRHCARQTTEYTHGLI